MTEQEKKEGYVNSAWGCGLLIWFIFCIIIGVVYCTGKPIVSGSDIRTAGLIWSSSLFLYLLLVYLITLASKKKWIDYVHPPQKAYRTLVPRSIIEEALVFFREVYNKYGTEAILLLHHDSFNWWLKPVEQNVNESSCAYNYAKEDSLVGTIHSHGSGPPIFSLVDIKNLDGLAIVIGYIDQPYPQVSVMYNGTSYPTEMFVANWVVVKGR